MPMALNENAHRIEMRGESMRKKRNPQQGEKKEGTKVNIFECEMRISRH
jgi:hypothetical protein